jgi:hypothetical protein
MKGTKFWLIVLTAIVISSMFHFDNNVVAVGALLVLLYWGINFLHGVWEGILDEIETQRVIGRD